MQQNKEIRQRKMKLNIASDEGDSSPAASALQRAFFPRRFALGAEKKAAARQTKITPELGQSERKPVDRQGCN